MSEVKRLEVVEMKLMDLERAMHEIHEVVVAQYRDIEALREKQRELLLRLERSDEPIRQLPPDEEVPPHY